MTLVSRRQWGAASPKDPPTRIPGPVKGVTCHWEGPAMGWPWPHPDCDDKVRGIQTFHQGERDWNDIAYNAIVCPHGNVYVGRGPGVRSAANGESDIGGNDQWYAVCFMAGVGDEFTAEGQAGMLEAIAWLRNDGHAGDAVNGHRDHHPTDCPGDVIYRWVQAGIPPAATPVLEDDMQLTDIINPKSPETDQLTVAQALRIAANASADSRRLLQNMADLADDVATAVEKAVSDDLAAGGGIEPASLRRIVRGEVIAGVRKTLGQLDEPKA